MAYVIAEPCIDNTDQSCLEACPVDCIASDPAIDRKLYIDPSVCIDCGACEAACPNGAIYRSDQLPPEWADFAWIDATWHTSPDDARAVVDEYRPAA